MKSSFHSLLVIPFLILFCHCQHNLIPLLQSSFRQACVSKLDSSLYAAQLNRSLQPLCTDHVENTISIVKEICLLIRCVAMDVLLLLALAPAEMYLSSRCLTMNIIIEYSFTVQFNILYIFLND
jgi:hypothetical protein